MQVQSTSIWGQRPHVEVPDAGPTLGGVGLYFVHFAAVGAAYLDAAWYTLARQDFTGITAVYVFDNNAKEPIEAIEAVLARHPLPVPVIVRSDKHGDPARTHSWSMNQVVAMGTEPWVLFARSDYLLADGMIPRFLRAAQYFTAEPGWGGFVTSYMWGLPPASCRDLPPDYLHPDASWRAGGAQTLIGGDGGESYLITDADAGVWLAERRLIVASSGWDEELKSWGWQQTVWQRGMRAVGAGIVTIPEFLYLHLFHHFPERGDIATSNREVAARGYQ